MPPAPRPASTAAFVMAHYATRPEHPFYLEQAVEGLMAQTDGDWRLFVVDDNSPLAEGRARLKALADAHPDRIEVLWSGRNLGPGPCRNLGVAEAARMGAPFVLYHDADDLADPRRLEETRRALAVPGVGFVYSKFRVVDEHSRAVPPFEVTPSVREILDVLDGEPPCGPGGEVLEALGTRTGYATLTSTVAVRTGLAVANPFPDELVSEDTYAWFQYAAAADEVAFLPGVLASYRIPRNCGGSSVRARVGGSFYVEKARVDSLGFFRALDVATERGRFDPRRRPEVARRFYERLATTMRGEGEVQLADALARDAALAVVDEAVTAGV